MAAKRAGRAYGWDRAIAGLAMAVDVLGVALGGYLAHLGLTDPRLAKLDQPKWVGGIGLFVVALGLGHLVVHAGMFASRRWAFVVGALLAGYGLSAGSAWASGVVLTYAVLRLGQVFGPGLR